ncbi:hypothetical protein CVT24_000664 [Panaeolus cyanescens]|uniref:Uncharacterized protein n=1 Tax=Panaeolus cyanescens TaxID=181874 RepID=A0A409W7L7_9AGAR|nr:hypothetical protein CVT24_000664 [Panaeolus cyanescens]
MFRPNDKVNQALRQYASDIASAALQGRLSSVEIIPPELTHTSMHTPETDDGRMRELLGKQQLVEAASSAPVTPNDRLAVSLKVSAGQLMQIAELIRTTPNRLEKIFIKNGDVIHNFYNLGVEIIVALWLSWNHTGLQKLMNKQDHVNAATDIQRCITKTLKYLEHVRDHRIGTFDQDPFRRMTGFMTDMRKAANNNFDASVLIIPRFLHLSPEYEVHKLNLSHYDYIRIEYKSGKPQRVPFAPTRTTVPAAGTTPFDLGAYAHSPKVDFGSPPQLDVKIDDPIPASKSDIKHVDQYSDLPQPVNSAQSSYHPPPTSPQYHQPIHTSNSSFNSSPIPPQDIPSAEGAPPPYSLTYNPPTQYSAHSPQDTSYPPNPSHAGPSHSNVATTVTQPPRKKDPRFPELDVPFDEYMAEINRKSAENRARALAMPIPIINLIPNPIPNQNTSYGMHWNEPMGGIPGRRSVTPVIEMPQYHYDQMSVYEQTSVNRRASSYETLTSQFGSLGVQDEYRPRRHRSERLSPNDVRGAYDYSMETGTRSRRSSLSERRTTRRKAEYASTEEDSESESDGERRKREKAKKKSKSKSKSKKYDDTDSEEEREKMKKTRTSISRQASSKSTSESKPKNRYKTTVETEDEDEQY